MLSLDIDVGHCRPRTQYLLEAIRGATDDCMEWPFASKSGEWAYGVVRFRGKQHNAHRVAYYFTTGEWPQVVRHMCDNPKCFNPRHLLAGTFKDNTQDAVTRGRTARGASHGRARLTPEQVEYIRATYRPGKHRSDRGNKAELAAMFQVHPATIWYAAKGKSWIYT